MFDDILNTAAQTTLDGDITDVATSLVINLVAGSPAGTQFYLWIDEECMLVKDNDGAGNYTNIVRGVDGTIAAAHLDAANVFYPLKLGILLRLALKSLTAVGAPGAAGADAIPVLLPNTITNFHLAATGTVTTLETVPSTAYAVAPCYLRNEGTVGNWLISFGGLTPTSISYSVKLGPGDATLVTMGEAYKEANVPIGAIKAFNDDPGSGGVLSGFVAWNDGTSPLAGPTGPAGATWRSGAGVPLNLLGVDGDFYLDTTNDNVYQKAAGAYSVITNIHGINGANGTGGDSYVNKFRLTLSSGNPVYNPQNATPNARSSNTASFAAAHGWTDGTICTPLTTTGGLTVGTKYFIHVISSTSVSFHTSVAGANDGTSNIVTLSGTPSQINVSGVSQTTLYCSPYNGDEIGLYGGSSWNVRSSAEFSIALGTLTSARPYDVFCYDNSGVPTLELLAWTSDTARATAIILQNGVWVKSGATTRRLLGTIRTDSTTTTIDDGGGIISQVGAKRFVDNVYNRVSRYIREFDSVASFSYSTNTWQQFNANAGNQCEFVSALGANGCHVTAHNFATTSSGSVAGDIGVNLDATTGAPFVTSGTNIPNGSSAMTARFDYDVTVGYHKLVWMQTGNGTGTMTWYGRNGTHQLGMSGAVMC